MVIYLHNVAPGKPYHLVEEYVSYLEDMFEGLEVNRSREDAAASCTLFDSDNNEHRKALSFSQWENSPVCLYLHPESDCYFWDKPGLAGSEGMELVHDVTGNCAHEHLARESGVVPPDKETA